MSLNEAKNKVRDFHQTFGQPAPRGPVTQPLAHARRRADWIKDECDELIRAGSVVDQADAYLDILYFALGGFVEIGVDPESLFDIVHAANMAKLWPDGLPHRREDGKIIKPPGWETPEPKLFAEIMRQKDSAEAP